MLVEHATLHQLGVKPYDYELRRMRGMLAVERGRWKTVLENIESRLSALEDPGLIRLLLGDEFHRNATVYTPYTPNGHTINKKIKEVLEAAETPHENVRTPVALLSIVSAAATPTPKAERPKAASMVTGAVPAIRPAPTKPIPGVTKVGEGPKTVVLLGYNQRFCQGMWPGYTPKEPETLVIDEPTTFLNMPAMVDAVIRKCLDKKTLPNMPLAFLKGAYLLLLKCMHLLEDMHASHKVCGGSDAGVEEGKENDRRSKINAYLYALYVIKGNKKNKDMADIFTMHETCSDDVLKSSDGTRDRKRVTRCDCMKIQLFSGAARKNCLGNNTAGLVGIDEANKSLFTKKGENSKTLLYDVEMKRDRIPYSDIMLTFALNEFRMMGRDHQCTTVALPLEDKEAYIYACRVVMQQIRAKDRYIILREKTKKNPAASNIPSVKPVFTNMDRPFLDICDCIILNEVHGDSSVADLKAKKRPTSAEKRVVGGAGGDSVSKKKNKKVKIAPKSKNKITKDDDAESSGSEDDDAESSGSEDDDAESSGSEDDDAESSSPEDSTIDSSSSDE